MKKKYIILSIITLVLLITFVTSFNYFKTSNNYVEDSVNNQTKITKGISMNLEQTAGSGDYKTVTQSSWPTDGYKFNAELSKCENGSTLSWDDTKKTVVFSGNVSDKCYVYFDIFIPKITDVCSNGDTLANCIKKYGDKGSVVSNIYIHNASLTNGAGDNSYRYAGGDAYPSYYSCKYDGNDVKNSKEQVNRSLKGDCSNIYKITVYSNNNEIEYFDKSAEEFFTSIREVKWDSTNNKCVTIDDEDVYDFYLEDITDETLCVGNAYYNSNYGVYEIGIEEVGAGEATLLSLTQENTQENNIANFVCFGTNKSPCPTYNLYRIIGVIDDKVKLIKYDFASTTLLGTDGDYDYASSETSDATYCWNYKATNKCSNTWSTSLLNKTNLNTNFINNIGTEWAKKIAMTTWKVGGNTLSNIVAVIPSVTYQNEIVSPVTTNSTDNATEYQAKIGLMYASDYGFAASPESWTTAMNSYNTVRNNNWMYMGLREWTISRRSDLSAYAFHVGNDGNVNFASVNSIIGVRPSFNLESSVKYVSGSGSMSDPVRVN